MLHAPAFVLDRFPNDLRVLGGAPLNALDVRGHDLCLGQPERVQKFEKWTARVLLSTLDPVVECLLGDASRPSSSPIAHANSNAPENLLPAAQTVNFVFLPAMVGAPEKSFIFYTSTHIRLFPVGESGLPSRTAFPLAAVQSCSAPLGAYAHYLARRVRLQVISHKLLLAFVAPTPSGTVALKIHRSPCRWRTSLCNYLSMHDFSIH